MLADAGYGIDYAFRQGLSDMGLSYAVGITSAVVVWPPGVALGHSPHCSSVKIRLCYDKVRLVKLFPS